MSEYMMSSSHRNEVLSKRRLYKSVYGWFESWTQSQRQQLLCDVTSHCNHKQLEYLATALEPVFHRDFVTSRFGRYPTRFIFNRKSRYSTFQHDLPGSYGTCPAYEQRTEDGLEAFVNEYVQDVLQVAIQRVTSTVEDSPHDIKLRENIEERIEDLSIKAGGTSQNHYRISQTHGLSSFTTIRNGSSQVSSQVSHIEANLDTDLLACPSRAVIPPIGDTTSNIELGSTRSKDVSSPVQRKPCLVQASSHQRCGTFPPGSMPSVTKLSTEDDLHRLKPGTLLQRFSTGRLSAVTSNMNPLLTVPALSSNSLPLKKENSKQITNDTFLTVSAQDFSPSGKTEKIGTSHTLLRTGKVKHLCQFQGIPVPLRCQSNSKAKRVNQSLFATKKMTLKRHFKDQMASVSQWMTKLEDHEKTEVIVELLKLCDQDLLMFFAKCLNKRLAERSNLNNLPDKVLLHVLSFLPADDLKSASLVCKRWNYIASHDELWRTKVFDLGLEEGILNLDDMLVSAMKNNSIDWKTAYREMFTIISHAKEKVKAPNQKLRQVKDELRKYFEYRVKEFLERIRPSNVDVDEDSSSSDSSLPEVELEAERTASGVVELPVTFMATTQSQIDAITAKANEEPEAITPQEESSKDDLKGTLGRRARKRQEMTKGADFALDVRPNHGQAQDLLSKSSSRSTQQPASIYPARFDRIKPIKRVRRLQGHMDAVCALMFDGRRIITGSMDHSIRVWDIRSGRSIKKIHGHLELQNCGACLLWLPHQSLVVNQFVCRLTSDIILRSGSSCGNSLQGGIRCLQFNERYIISGSWDMSIRVWDIVKFTQVAILTGHSGVVSCLQFNDSCLVTGSHDKSIRVWSMDDFKCRSIYRHHQGGVTCLVFHNQFIVSGSTDRTVKICDLETGKCVMSFPDATDPISAVHVRGNLILGATVTGQLFCWKEDKSEAIAGIQLSTSPIYRILFIPDTSLGAHFLIGLGDGSIQEWDLVTMTCLRALYGHKGAVRDVQSSPDRIVSCSDDGNVRIWDLMPPPLRVGDKADKDTIATTTIHQRRELARN